MDPFTVDTTTPKFQTRVAEMSDFAQSRRPSALETKKKLVTLNAKLDKHRIAYEKLMEEIPDLVTEIVFWNKYQKHKEQQDQSMVELKKEEDNLRNQQRELEDKKRALKQLKSAHQQALPALIHEEQKVNAITNKKQICVIDMVGTRYFPEVDLTTPIDDLFNYYFSNFQGPKADCTLMSTTKHLVLGKSFEEQGIGEMSTIYLHVRQRGGNDENDDEIDKMIKRLILGDDENVVAKSAFPSTPFDA